MHGSDAVTMLIVEELLPWTRPCFCSPCCGDPASHSSAEAAAADSISEDASSPTPAAFSVPVSTSVSAGASISAGAPPWILNRWVPDISRSSLSILEASESVYLLVSAGRVSV